jgi:hypothetical protein
VNSLKTSNINLLISGQVLRKKSLLSFWGGFINIQKQLPSVYSKKTVFSHSWDPEYSSLVRHVYGEHDWISEKQPEYSHEILGSIENVASFEEGGHRVGSTWANISFQNVLGNLESRSKVAKAYQPNGDYCLFVRWDFGLSGEYPVNVMSYDPLLPTDHLYVADYAHSDEGYADMWVGVPGEDVYKFAGLFDFAVKCLTLKNDFYELMTNKGWPKTFKVDDHSGIVRKIILRARIKLLKPKILTVFDALRVRDNHDLLSKIIRRISRIIIRKLTLPKIQAEYYARGDISEATFSKIQSLNIHSIFKLFCYRTELRSKVRFCRPEDSNNIERGNLINSRLNKIEVSDEGPFCVDDYTLNAIAHWMTYEKVSIVYLVDDISLNDIEVDFPGVQYGSLGNDKVKCTIINKALSSGSQININDVVRSKIKVYKYVQV